MTFYSWNISSLKSRRYKTCISAETDDYVISSRCNRLHHPFSNFYKTVQIIYFCFHPTPLPRSLLVMPAAYILSPRLWILLGLHNTIKTGISIRHNWAKILPLSDFLYNYSKHGEHRLWSYYKWSRFCLELRHSIQSRLAISARLGDKQFLGLGPCFCLVNDLSLSLSRLESINSKGA